MKWRMNTAIKKEWTLQPNKIYFFLILAELQMIDKIRWKPKKTDISTYKNVKYANNEVTDYK